MPSFHLPSIKLSYVYKIFYRFIIKKSDIVVEDIIFNGVFGDGFKKDFVNKSLLPKWVVVIA